MKNLPLKIKNNIFKIFIELFVPNRLKRSHLKARWAKKYLRKYILTPKESSAEVSENGIIIWQYWHQGRDTAPLLVQKCFESIEKYESDKKIIVLSYETIKNYINLPQKYYDMVDSGKMSIAHFSDIVRLYLLEKYGGLWIDSTIFLTDKIDKKIYESDFCVMQKNQETDEQENKMSCFFIRAKNNSPHIRFLKSALEKYWEENDFVINYFMFEHISTILSNYNQELQSEWNQMPFLDAKTSGKLQLLLNKTFSQKEFDKIKSETSIHKLSYKVSQKNMSGNTYYNYILGDYKTKKISVVIPTLQKKVEILDRLIDSLNKDDSVSEIILIDNSTKGYKRDCQKLKVIIPNENLYVNPAWNLGVKESKEDIVALLNDDIIISDNFCKNIIHQMTPEMGIIGFNSTEFVKPISDINIDIPEQNIVLKKANFMDKCFGMAMFFYKSNYIEIPNDIKITYGDVWLYNKNLKSGKKNYRISGQIIYHWGSLSSSAKSLNKICKKDAKIFKRRMVSWKDRFFSYENIWDCYKIRILGITYKISKTSSQRTE